MSWILLDYSRASRMKRTWNLIKNVVLHTIETGTLTCTAALVDLILFLFFPDNYLHISVYSNALLTSLNARKRSLSEGSSIQFNDINVLESTTVSRTRSPTRPIFRTSIQMEDIFLFRRKLGESTGKDFGGHNRSRNSSEDPGKPKLVGFRKTPSGLVLASRLSESPKFSVSVLEAGHDFNNTTEMSIPGHSLFCGRTGLHEHGTPRRETVNYVTTEQPFINNRTMTSEINWYLLTRGHKEDSNGQTLTVSTGPFKGRHPFGVQISIPCFSTKSTDIFNGNATGAWVATHAIHPEDEVVHSSHALKVLFEQDERTGKAIAKGVDYHLRSSRKTVNFVRTPRLLELSGIGDKAILNKMKIRTIVDLPGVGKNLRSLLDFTHRRSRPEDRIKDIVDLTGKNKPDGPSTALELQRNYYSSNRFIACTIKDYPLSLSSGQPAVPGKRYLSFLIALQHTFSRESVHISSSEPFTPPAINPNMLREQVNLEILVEGIKYQNVSLGEILPGEDIESDEDIKAYIRKEDPELRVYGSDDLRVTKGCET
ncbi:hypothetical protein L218DRAFT_950163 [Marasmius fiardii PR-910]|nr:hypothetical protein L218DRAFT_950163 [Marasmius fiardii PR-910]